MAKDFNIGYSTVKKIRQNAEEIRKIALNNRKLNRKRKHESPNEEIGEALSAWFHQMRAKSAIINGTVNVGKSQAACDDARASRFRAVVRLVRTIEITSQHQIYQSFG